MKPDHIFFIILDLFLLLGVWMFFQLLILINCHEQSDYNKWLRAKKSICQIIEESFKKDERYKWFIQNKTILMHYYEKYHSNMSLKDFIILAKEGELYLDT